MRCVEKSKCFANTRKDGETECEGLDRSRCNVDALSFKWHTNKKYHFCVPHLEGISINFFQLCLFVVKSQCCRVMHWKELWLLMSKSNQCLLYESAHTYTSWLVIQRTVWSYWSSLQSYLFNITFLRLHFNIFLQLKPSKLDYTHTNAPTHSRSHRITNDK